MLNIIRSLFSSPEKLLSVLSRSDIQDLYEDGERVLINEDGGASVNTLCREVQRDFAGHVATLCNVSTGYNPGRNAG